jgi:hypothetical protein
MDFEQEFKKWAASSVSGDIPPEVQAFSFNLFEAVPSADVKFGIELIGAAEFDENDSDWPCSEVWEPDQRQLSIPVAFSGQDWEQCLERVKGLVVQFLSEPSWFCECA